MIIPVFYTLSIEHIHYNGYRVFTGGEVLPGHDTDPSPTSSAEV